MYYNHSYMRKVHLYMGRVAYVQKIYEQNLVTG